MTEKPAQNCSGLNGKMPRHIAIIMDGNGRWASGRGMQRSQGHFRGVDSVIEITRACSDLGIGYLTLYGFSTENWKRPQPEVDILMHLIGDTIAQQTPFLVENNVRLNLIGEIERIPVASRAKLQAGVSATAHCTGLVLTMALSYSGRWDIAQAARKLALKVQRGEMRPEDIDEEAVARNLDTYPLPDPDLLIRTGGEERISNFLLWQSAYSELYFTHILWPDFGKEQLLEALTDYRGRERRFGKTSQQVQDTHDQA
ncbi:isoprenyl transferase [Prevotella sp. CAG:485]|nr:isoprenyl transferase [Prevotella sp. CAG:485]